MLERLALAGATKMGQSSPAGMKLKEISFKLETLVLLMSTVSPPAIKYSISY
jgi:hypothetical protein